MTEIGFKEVENYLRRLRKKGATERFSPAYLIWGEEMLYKNAFAAVLDALIPGAKKSLNYEPFDGANENVYTVLERLNTFSFLSGNKVVALLDSGVFYSKADENALLEKVKKAFGQKKIQQSAKAFLLYLSLMNLTLEDVENTKSTGRSPMGDAAWLDPVIDYCKTKGLKAPSGNRHAEDLKQSIEKGFPEGNHLIVTADRIDKRKSLYKAFKTHGVVIDCSVPRGDRRADKMAQEGVLKETMAAVLKASGKTMAPQAYHCLCDMTGFDLRTFSGNLEKLVSYVGDRSEITPADVTAVLKRTKQDPIYEFTNALTDKNTENALFYMKSLLEGGTIGHPLQLLSAAANQVRRLLLYKGFAESDRGKVWQAGMDYFQFKNTVMQAIEQHDRTLLDRLGQWESVMAQGLKTGAGEKKKKARPSLKRGKTDLLLAKNSNNPYPVYMMMLKSEKFSRKELTAAVDIIRSADRQMKKSGVDPRLILENVVFAICQGAGQRPG